MPTELTDDDVALMLAEIRRFCQKSIRPMVQRPEQTLGSDELARLTDQAADIGLVNLTADPGAGLWEDPDRRQWVKLSLGALRTVARAAAGIAFHFHQLALGRYVARSLGIDQAAPSIVCVQGTFGLARYSLARLLKGSTLDEEDLGLLRDYFLTFDSTRQNLPLLFQAADGWRELLVPWLDAEGKLGWAALAREDLDVAAVPHSHGLDETLTWQWQPSGDESPRHRTPAGAEGLELYARVLGLNARALMALGLGSLEQAYEKATEYAALRKQGGKPIGQHAAVRLMLARAAGTIRTVEMLVEQLADLAVVGENLGTVMAVRAGVHNLLCAAANDAMQTFGGSGYTREVGLEKIVRDGNHLRLLCGTPDELLLFVSQWEDHG